MAGKLCSGAPTNNAGNIKNSKSYCEGAIYRAEGTLVSRPITSNPHESGSEAAISWESGWTYAENQSGGYAGAFACCAALGDVVV